MASERGAVDDTRDAQPSLSVVVPSTHLDPGECEAVAALTPQIDACGGEVVFVDGRPDASEPRASDRYRHVVVPCADVFELRAVGVSEARGDVVAILEDHTVPRADWCAEVLRAHREHPEAVVAGAVVNGTAEHAIDRANFYLSHARNLPPLRTTPPDCTPSPANISFKRRALPRDRPPPGWIDYVLVPTLLGSNDLVADDRALVSHDQSLGLRWTIANHFRAGRSVSGLSCARRPEARRQIIDASVRLFPRQLETVLPIMRRREGRRRAWADAPAVIVLAASGAIGCLVGCWFGAGKSARRLV